MLGPRALSDRGAGLTVPGGLMATVVASPAGGPLMLAVHPNTRTIPAVCAEIARSPRIPACWPSTAASPRRPYASGASTVQPDARTAPLGPISCPGTLAIREERASYARSAAEPAYRSMTSSSSSAERTHDRLGAAVLTTDDRDRVAHVCDVDADENLATLLHGSPSCGSKLTATGD